MKRTNELSEDYINDESVSAEALAVLAYLCANHQIGDFIKIDDIKNRFGWGDHKWRKVSHDLRTNMILCIGRDSFGTKLRFEGLI